MPRDVYKTRDNSGHPNLGQLPIEAYCFGDQSQSMNLNVIVRVLLIYKFGIFVPGIKGWKSRCKQYMSVGGGRRDKVLSGAMPSWSLTTLKRLWGSTGNQCSLYWRSLSLLTWSKPLTARDLIRRMVVYPKYTQVQKPSNTLVSLYWPLSLNVALSTHWKVAVR